MSDFIQQWRKKFACLSDREFQVLQSFGNGLSRKEMAILMNISIKTFNTYRGRMHLKLGTSNEILIALYAYKLGLIEVKE